MSRIVFILTGGMVKSGDEGQPQLDVVVERLCDTIDAVGTTMRERDGITSTSGIRSFIER
jgi:hypothetical protein